MTTTEQRELDAFIAEKVMGWKWMKYLPEENHAYSGCRTLTNEPHKYLVKSNGKEPLAEDAFYNVPKYTTDRAASDALDDKILAEHAGYRITFDGKNYTMTDTILQISEKHPDKKTCRALFAQKIWTK